jgi:hypothetical protein
MDWAKAFNDGLMQFLSVSHQFPGNKSACTFSRTLHPEMEAPRK